MLRKLTTILLVLVGASTFASTVDLFGPNEHLVARTLNNVHLEIQIPQEPNPALATHLEALRLLMRSSPEVSLSQENEAGMRVHNEWNVTIRKRHGALNGFFGMFSDRFALHSANISFGRKMPSTILGRYRKTFGGRYFDAVEIDTTYHLDSDSGTITLTFDYHRPKAGSKNEKVVFKMQHPDLVTPKPL